jgi:hypothetical protein
MRQYVAGVSGGSWIDRHVSFIDVLNDPVLIDDEGGAIAEALFFIKNSVVFNHGSLKVAQQWKGYPDVLCKTAVGRNAIDADAEDLCICSFEFGDISLIRLQFFRSTTGEGQHIKCQHHIFLSLEIAQLHLLPGRTWQREIRRRVTDLQVRLRRGRLLRTRDHTQDQQQAETKSSLDHYGPPPFMQLNLESSLLCDEPSYKIRKPANQNCKSSFNNKPSS